MLCVFLQVKNFRPYAKQLNPKEVSKSASKRNLGKEQAPRNFNKHGIIMGMQNAEFSTVNFVIKYEIDAFKKRLRHACEMIAETFRCKFGFSLTQKDFTADNLRELRDRLSVRGKCLLHCDFCVLCMPDCAGLLASFAIQNCFHEIREFAPYHHTPTALF